MAKNAFGLTPNIGVFGNTINKKPRRQPVSKNQKNAVKIKQRGRCYDCHKILVVEDYHHIKHVANNGKSITQNLVALCPECHRKRHIKESAEKTDKTRIRPKKQDFEVGISKLNSPSIENYRF